MKTRIFGLAVMLSLAAVVGACENPGANTTPATPAPGEPADTGATPPATTPAASPTKAP